MMLASNPETSRTDEALANSARSGTRGAFVILVARYRDRIYRMAMRMSRNPSDAEEITQETFLQAHRGMASFRNQARFGTWLYRIAMNEALMRRRTAKRRPLESLDALSPRLVDVGMVGAQPDLHADDLIDSKTIAARVQAALEELDEGHRAALVLRDLEGLSADEAAEILGVSPDAVRQRAHRARLKLRGLLADLVAESPKVGATPRTDPPG